MLDTLDERVVRRSPVDGIDKALVRRRSSERFALRDDAELQSRRLPLVAGQAISQDFRDPALSVDANSPPVNGFSRSSC